MGQESRFGGVGLLQPLRHRDFRLLWIGMTVSMIGDGFFLVALAWQVYDLDANPAAFAAVGVAWTLPQVLFMVPAGVLADRIDRRYLMIAGDLLRAFAVGALALLALTGAITIPLIIGLAALFGVGDALFLPSFTSIIPVLVPDDELMQANSLSEFVSQATRTLLGPFIGGIVIAVAGVGAAFMIDGLSFVFSAVMIALMAHRHTKSEERASSLHDLKEGFAFVRRTPWFWINLVSTCVAILLTVGAWEALIPYIVKEELHESAAALGLVYAAGGVGAIVIALFFGQKGTLPRRPLTAYYLAWVIGNLAMIGFGLAFSLWQVVLIATFVQAMTASIGILWFTMEYRLVPQEILGRVSAIDWVVVLAGLPLSFALVGPLAEWIGVRQTLMLTGALGAVAMAIPLFIPAALTPERDGSFDEPEPEAIEEATGPANITR